MSQTNSNVAPVQTGVLAGTSNINLEDVQNYWNKIIKTEQLQEDETARIVFQARVKPNLATQYENLKNFEITESKQLRTAVDVFSYIEEKTRSLPHHDVGISISSAVYNYDPTNVNEKGNVKAPSYNTLKKINSLVFDIDAHIKGSKERFHIYTLDDKYIQVVILRSYIEIMDLLNKNGWDMLKPSMTLCTGGGVQLAFDFDRDIYPEEAKNIFTRLGDMLGKKVFGCIVQDMLGNFSEVDLEIDPTFKDVTHTQRMAGLVNQKYQYTAQYFSDRDNTTFNNDLFNFGNSEEYKAYLKTLILSIDEDILSTNYEDSKKKIFEEYYSTILKEVQKLSASGLDANGNTVCALEMIDVDKANEDAKIVSIQKRTSINPSEYNPMEYDIILKLKEKVNEGFDMRTLFPDITLWENHGSYYKILCPFHEERTPSMAVYFNSLIFRDFHDDTNYGIVAFWEQMFNVNKATAISQIADKAGIKFKKGDKKEFEKMELAELIDTLIDKIDTESFVYYRLANKNRNCVVRHIDTGESFGFDGSKMLASHILSNQLNIHDVDKEFIHEFNEAFESKILIEAFEEFHPGKPTVFQRQFIKFVNLWVPSKNYKKSHDQADIFKEEVCKDGLDIPATIEMLKDKCPWTYQYILQMVQRGDLEWFVNWMASTAQFKVLPTIPVVFGIGGAGKNLFVSTILEWFINGEYVKILSGDRVMSNFNSVLETASLLVLDEGDFSSGQQVDQLKLLTGNDKMLIEKKGVDAISKSRFFNILFFSNGEIPVRHPAMDRRISYFNNEVTLLELVGSMGITIDQFVANIKDELTDFWGTLLCTNLNMPQGMSNNKDGLFYEQIFKMHPFGALVIKLLKDEWKEIALQLNENVSDPTMMKSNLELLDQIKDQFHQNGSIALTLINRYLQSLNYKYKTSIQKYIQTNGLENFGVGIDIVADEVQILINKTKLKSSLKIENILFKENKDLSKKFNRIKKAISRMDPKEILSSEDGALSKDEAEHIIEAEEQEILFENNSEAEHKEPLAEGTLPKAPTLKTPTY